MRKFLFTHLFFLFFSNLLFCQDFFEGMKRNELKLNTPTPAECKQKAEDYCALVKSVSPNVTIFYNVQPTCISSQISAYLT